MLKEVEILQATDKIFLSFYKNKAKLKFIFTNNSCVLLKADKSVNSKEPLT